MTITVDCVQKVDAQLGETPLWDARDNLLRWITRRAFPWAGDAL